MGRNKHTYCKSIRFDEKIKTVLEPLRIITKLEKGEIRPTKVILVDTTDEKMGHEIADFVKRVKEDSTKAERVADKAAIAVLPEAAANQTTAEAKNPPLSNMSGTSDNLSPSAASKLLDGQKIPSEWCARFVLSGGLK